MGTTSSVNTQRLLDPHQEILSHGKRIEDYRTTTAVKTPEKKAKLPVNQDYYQQYDTNNSLPGTDLYASPSGLYTIRLYQPHFAAEVVGPLGKSVVDPAHHHVVNTFLEKYKVCIPLPLPLVFMYSPLFSPTPLFAPLLSPPRYIFRCYSDLGPLFWTKSRGRGQLIITRHQTHTYPTTAGTHTLSINTAQYYR